MPDDNGAAAGQDGSSWIGSGLFDLFRYGVTKAVDSEFREPFKPDATQPLATNASGGVFKQGSPAFSLSVGAISPIVLIGGALLLILLLKK